jgi:hypothetical protein
MGSTIFRKYKSTRKRIKKDGIVGKDDGKLKKKRLV